MRAAVRQTGHSYADNMEIDEAREKLSEAKRRLAAAQEQFDTALPGWPNDFVGPVTAGQQQALTTLIAREQELPAVQRALLDAHLAHQKNTPDA